MSIIPTEYCERKELWLMTARPDEAAWHLARQPSLWQCGHHLACVSGFDADATAAALLQVRAQH
jgi:hypothetical protein